MAITLTDLTPLTWTRTKIWSATSSLGAVVEDVLAGQAHNLGAIGGDNTLTSKATADAAIKVATRYEGATEYGQRPISITFDATGLLFTVRMEGGTTGYIVMRRPHSFTR